MAAMIPAPTEAPARSWLGALLSLLATFSVKRFFGSPQAAAAATQESGNWPLMRSNAEVDRITLSKLAALAKTENVALTAMGKFDGTPRSVAFNVQAFRLAVNKCTGAIRILRSVHAADAGTVINPMQCRGQIEGGVAQSLGAALYEEMVIDKSGRVINPAFRNYHLPQFGDVPRTEVLFARYQR